MDIKKTYKAKVLLFGEYSVIQGSDALAMPSELFSGFWAFREGEFNKQAILKKLGTYLNELDFDKVCFQDKVFKEAIKRHLFFDSNIPIGYGVGSSGAVCAAIFDRYFQKEGLLDLLELKRILGQIESFFHGSSSGLDPLICYLDQAVLIHQGQTGLINLPKQDGEYHFFLLDTNISRQTGPLVNLYLNRYQSDLGFKNAIDEKLSMLNNLAIQQYLKSDLEALFYTFHSISDFQWEYFRAMIPETCQAAWRIGLETDAFKIKLCGAGGGGFLLAMCRDQDKIERLGFKVLKLSLGKENQ